MPAPRALSITLHLAALLPAALLPDPAQAQAQAQAITIYRCVGKDGALTLRDSPCAAGETQQTLSMQRPQDPPRAPLPAPVAPPTTPPVEPRREVQVVYRTPPRPMYECVSPEGARYTSDSGEGQTRWVPLWTLGYPLGHGGRDRRPPPPAAGSAYPALAGAWVRDECHALPQAEVCARLSDRRYEIIRRYNSAMQSERHELEREQRGIDARLANDCGGS